MYVAIFAPREPWNVYALGTFVSEIGARDYIERYVEDEYPSRSVPGPISKWSWEDGYYCSDNAEFGFVISQVKQDIESLRP